MQSSPPVSKNKGPEIILTAEEKHAYRQFFLAADEENNGVITGQNAVRFFGKSRLDPSTLSKIWTIADSESKGFLTKQTFSIAVKLIAQVQNGKPLDPANINADAPLPRFEGIHIEPYQKLSGPGSLEPNNNNIISDEDREKYKDMFYKCNPVNGILEGEKARDFFVRSKLPVEKLGKIWMLADTKNRGKLDLPEFIIAMHFIQQTMRGTVTLLPSELPSGFYEMASGAATRNISSPKLGQSPVTRHMTLESSVTTSPKDNSWDVNEKDKASYDRLFDSLDEDKKGYITGEGAANFFMKSKLAPDHLAIIWDLADINKSGRLSRDEFAVAMYLITKKLVGVPLPPSLPNSLIPPSMRTASPFTDLNMTMGQTPSRSHTLPNDHDLFFESLPHTTSSSPFPSNTTSLPGNELDLLGDTDLNTKIALESGEIKNYKLKSENFNNATAELKTNRANIESNISSLVTQKQDMITQLSQIRTLYESEAKATREVQAKYELEHESVEKVRQELLQAEKALKAIQLERDQLHENIQKDRDETLDIKRRIRIAEEETVSIKAEIEKLKKDGRQQKGFLAINRKQLAAVEGEKEKSSKILQSFEDKDSSSQDVDDPFGTGMFTPPAFSPLNTTQASGVIGSQSITERVDFNETGSLQKSSRHSHHGSLSSIDGVKRSMSNASIASNSTLGTSSVKSAPLYTNNNKPDEPSFDKPITIASSKPSEFENILGDSNIQQEIAANANVAESNKVSNPFDSTFNDPFGGVSSDQTVKSNEENTIQRDTVKESEKSEADPFANLNNVPTSGKSNFDSAFPAAFNTSDNDNLDSDLKEFPSLEEFDNDFTSLTTNNEKKDESNSSTQNEKSENTYSTETATASLNNVEIKNGDKDTNNTFNKESESLFSIAADSTEPAENKLQDSDAWVSIESSATKSITQDDFDAAFSDLTEAKDKKSITQDDFEAAFSDLTEAKDKKSITQDDFEAAFSDLTEAKVTKTPPIDFDAGFDDADFETDVNFTFDAPTTSTSTNNNISTISSTTNNFAKPGKSSLDFDKGFDDFDPLSSSASSSNKPKANLDAAFGGGISSELSQFGFDDAFSEFLSDKQSTATTQTNISKSPKPKTNSSADDDIDDLKKLLEYGYPREKAVEALERNNYDFQKSIEYLLK